MRVKLTAAVAAVALAAAALADSETGASIGGARLVFSGSVTLAPLAGKACKGYRTTKPKRTYVVCQDAGPYRMEGKTFPAAYNWRWTFGAGNPVPEAGSFAIKLRDGNVNLTMSGAGRGFEARTGTTGTTTTVGTWKYQRGTGAYANRSGSGTYTFKVEHTATTYTHLTLSLRGAVR